MEKLSKQDEARIMRSLEEASDLIKSGQHPNDALHRVLTEGSFTPQMAQRMVEATNTALHLSHLKTASGSARAESFPMADTKVIFDQLYPVKVEAPAAKAAEALISVEYRRRESQNYLKLASPALPRLKVQPYGEASESCARRVRQQQQQLDKAAEAARLEYARQNYLVWNLAKAASDYFRLADHVPFAEVERRVTAEYGPVGRSCMDLLYGWSNGAARREKRAEASGQSLTLLYDSRRAPYDQIACLIKAAEQLPGLAKQAAATEVVRKQHDEAELGKYRRKKGPSRTLSPLASDEPVKPMRKVTGTNEPPAKAAALLGEPRPFAKAALDFGEAAVESGLKAVGMGEPPAVDLGAMSSVLDPAHETEIRTAKTRAMLHEFMTADPIISSYDAGKISSAFNQISQLAPTVAQQPGVMRGMMRKILQQEGVLEPFEADQLTKLEKQLMMSVKDVPAEATMQAGQLKA